jgi:hypothetical protein
MRALSPNKQKLNNHYLFLACIDQELKPSYATANESI